MNIRPAQPGDLPALLEIFAHARAFMAQTGNPTQWPAAYPGAELYLCVGSDMLLTFTQWYRWQDMLAMAALVVESREAGDEPALQAAAADLTAQGGRVLFARAEAYPCASSDIRSGKIPLEQWLEVLPPETLRVVQENHLYSAEKEV